jgi:hypothetical protein
MNTLNRLLKKSNRLIDEESQKTTINDVITSNGLTDTNNKSNLSALSTETDPRVKKLKKELEKINIAPKPKYIYFNFKK